ncbi:MAG: thioredoxin domain-containing protein [Bacteroidota bacterium]
MSFFNIQLIKKPWAIFGLLLSALVVFGLVLFVVQVGKYAFQINAGETNPFEADRLKVSVTSFLLQAPIYDVDQSRILSGSQDPALGSANAKIQIVEFVDYECPVSKSAASEIRAFMMRHPDDVLFIVRDFPLESIHNNAMNAALAARCVFEQGDDEKYWKFHDLLFKYQISLNEADLKSFVQAVGVDESDYDRCFSSRAHESTIQKSIEDGMAAGVRGTPTFFINGRRVPGAMNLATLELIYNEMNKE